jgi:hypothetical protein
VSTAPDRAPTAETRLAPVIKEAIHKIWPAAFIAAGLVLTAAWTCFLGYEFVQLVN